MKLNSKNKIAALNAEKHKESYVYVTVSFLHNATTGAWLGGDYMLKYFSGKHEGKPIKDGKKLTVVLPKNAHATPA